MNAKFDRLMAKMPEQLKCLKSKPALTRDNLTDIPKQGVYVFYQDNKPVYVGRSNTLKQRIQQHGRPSSKHNSATFAYNIAKEIMGRDKPIPKSTTRKELEEAPGFERMFFEARNTVANMQIRTIEIKDQFEQALFEIYAVLTLNTTNYNDFSTH